MNTSTAAFEPAANLLAKLLSGVPGLLVPALIGLAVVLCVLVLIDGYVDRAFVDEAR